MTPEVAVPHPVVVPLWRRTGQGVDADRPGVLRGHPGPVASERPESAPEEDGGTVGPPVG
ncbi:hypothetical protein AB0O91_13750 [Kitasatospora sp. NPDC089797]|uniref:hypothetical protein n=1 Tax=Kitasatospora sp. NPDC089797 TaxID=3155298 RepID=UPI003426F0A0